MESANGGKSSLEVVQEFLDQLQGREPRLDEVRRIRPALDELVAKVTRLHRMSPAFAAVTLSPEVLRLVRMSRELDSGFWRSAAVL